MIARLRSSKRCGNGVVVSVAAKDEHGQIVGSDGVAIDELVELVSQDDVGRDFCHQEQFEVRTSLSPSSFMISMTFCFVYAAAERDHDVQVLQAEFFADFLDCFQFEAECSGVFRIIVTGSASPAEEVAASGFVFVAALEVSVFAGLEVGEAQSNGS